MTTQPGNRRCMDCSEKGNVVVVVGGGGDDGGGRVLLSSLFCCCCSLKLFLAPLFPF